MDELGFKNIDNKGRAIVNVFDTPIMFLYNFFFLEYFKIGKFMYGIDVIDIDEN